MSRFLISNLLLHRLTQSLSMQPGKVVDEIGEENVLQVVTDNEPSVALLDWGN